MYCYDYCFPTQLLLLLEGISFLIEVFGRCSEVENMSLDQWLTSGVLDQAVKLMEDCILLSSHKSYPADIRERVRQQWNTHRDLALNLEKCYM